MTSRSGKVKLNQIVALVVVVVLGIGAAWWFTHGGDKKAKEALEKANAAANDAKAAAENNVRDQNASFDASRARQIDKHAPGAAGK